MLTTLVEFGKRLWADPKFRKMIQVSAAALVAYVVAVLAGADILPPTP